MTHWEDLDMIVSDDRMTQFDIDNGDQIFNEDSNPIEYDGDFNVWNDWDNPHHLPFYEDN